MKQKRNDILMQNQAFGWVAGATALILSIPLFFTIAGSAIPNNGWNWGFIDFVIMAILLFGSGSLFILIARKVRSTNYRIAIGIGFIFALLAIWSELAVGAVSQLLNNFFI